MAWAVMWQINLTPLRASGNHEKLTAISAQIPHTTGLNLGGFVFLFQSVAVAANVDRCRTMQEPVEGGRGHDGIPGKDLVPIGESFVASQDDGLLFLITLTNGIGRAI